MHKILVAHESPLCLLEESLQYNDYQYCLAHLCGKFNEYKNFFDRCYRNNKEVLMDNGAFELGKPMNWIEYQSWIEQLHPTHYIVPDALEDKEQTITNFKEWVKQGRIDGQKIGAIQGKTYQEISDCYRYMVDNADYIAVSFDFSYYELTGIGRTQLEKFCTGRQRLINQFLQDGIWDWSKPVHLLGCSLAKEFTWYVNNNIYNIRSIDTSNPVMAGITYMQYSGSLGLKTKPKGLLADHMEIRLDPEQSELIQYNIKEFRKIIEYA